MDVLIDTCIWSKVLRSKTKDITVAREVAEIIKNGQARIIGMIRQEVLSGMKFQNQFELVKTQLRSFPDVMVNEEIHEYAAELYNKCVANGIQGSHTDLLICAVAKKYRFSIYTTDNDFTHYDAIIKLNLYMP